MVARIAGVIMLSSAGKSLLDEVTDLRDGWVRCDGVFRGSREWLWDD
jgi:hypothetical protein